MFPKIQRKKKQKEKDPLIISQNGSTYTNYMFHVELRTYVRIILLVNLSRTKTTKKETLLLEGKELESLKKSVSNGRD